MVEGSKLRQLTSAPNSPAPHQDDRVCNVKSSSAATRSSTQSWVQVFGWLVGFGFLEAEVEALEAAFARLAAEPAAAHGGNATKSRRLAGGSSPVRTIIPSA
jgi:hypothetical protein